MTSSINDLPDEIIAKIILYAVRKHADQKKRNDFYRSSFLVMNTDLPQGNIFMALLYKYG